MWAVAVAILVPVIWLAGFIVLVSEAAMELPGGWRARVPLTTSLRWAGWPLLLAWRASAPVRRFVANAVAIGQWARRERSRMRRENRR